MRRIVHVRSTRAAYLGILCLSFGCSSNEGSSSTVTVDVAPSSAQALTCSNTTFHATVSGSADQSVTWSEAPSGAGSVAAGIYTAPDATPVPASVTVTATSLADPSASASAQVELGTAFPSAPATLAGSSGYLSAGTGAGVYVHTFAARGKRVYASWPDNTAGTSKVALKVARSDDGGHTWRAAVAAISTNLQGNTVDDATGIECPALAIDAGDPDVVYAIGHIDGTNDLGETLDDALSGAQTLLLAVSTDGAVTWKTRILHVGAGGDICADVASPEPDTVVVVSPGWNGCDLGHVSSRDFFAWSDGARGVGFDSGSYTDAPHEYFAAGYTGGLDDLIPNDACTAAHIFPEADGGSDDAGDTTEAPRLSVGSDGTLCVTYVGDVFPGDMLTNTYTQCSSDAGQTFSAPVELDPNTTKPPSSAMGALGPDGSSAVLWTTGDPPDGGLYLATAAPGAAFGAPRLVPVYAGADGSPLTALNPVLGYDAAGVLWIAYRAENGENDSFLVVDKSCDGGSTWSGAVVLASPAPLLKWPSLAFTDAAAPLVQAWSEDHAVSFTLAPSE